MWFWELLVVAKKVSGNNGRTSWGSQLISSSVWFPDISQSKTLSCIWVAGKFASTCSSDSSKYMHFSSPGGLNKLIYISMAWHGYYCYMVLPMDGTLHHQDSKKLNSNLPMGPIQSTYWLQLPLICNHLSSAISFAKYQKSFPVKSLYMESLETHHLSWLTTTTFRATSLKLQKLDQVCNIITLLGCTRTEILNGNYQNCFSIPTV